VVTQSHCEVQGCLPRKEIVHLQQNKNYVRRKIQVRYAEAAAAATTTTTTTNKGQFIV